MSATSRSVDGPGAALLRRLEELAGTSTDVGVQGPDGGDAGPHQPSGEPIAEIAAVHEFGIDTPERPFIAPGLAAARPQLERAAADAVGAAMAGSPEAASAVIGPIAQAAIVGEIDAQGLVQSGQLRGAVRWAHRGPA